MPQLLRSADGGAASYAQPTHQLLASRVVTMRRCNATRRPRATNREAAWSQPRWPSRRARAAESGEESRRRAESWRWRNEATAAEVQRRVTKDVSLSRRSAAPPSRARRPVGGDFGVRLRSAESKIPLRARGKCRDVLEVSSGARDVVLARTLRERIGAERRERLRERGRCPAAVRDLEPRAIDALRTPPATQHQRLA